MLESVYEVVAKHLLKRGFRVERQQAISFIVDDTEFTDAFRADLVIEDVLVVEVKSAEKTLPVHIKQLLTYLRMMKRPLGFVMNFGTATFKEGVRRVANDYWHDGPPQLIGAKRS
jgi:iron complex transport system substrate-binding protein